MDSDSDEEVRQQCDGPLTKEDVIKWATEKIWSDLVNEAMTRALALEPSPELRGDEMHLVRLANEVLRLREELDGLKKQIADTEPEFTANAAKLARVEALRTEVQTFACIMEAQLRANDHKSGWKDDEPLPLLRRLREETEELVRALVGEGDVGKEAADIANFAMMIADVYGALRDEPITPPSKAEPLRGPWACSVCGHNHQR